MPILTYITRASVGAPEIISGGTYKTAIDVFGNKSTTFSQTREILTNTAFPDESERQTITETITFSSVGPPSWSYALTRSTAHTRLSGIASYGSAAISFHEATSENILTGFADQGFRSTYTWLDNDTWGATEVEASGSATNGALVYSFSRTSRARQAVGRSFTGTTGGISIATTTGSSSSTSYTSTAAKYFKDSARVAVSSALTQTVTRRTVTSSSTRTHTITYGGSSYTFVSTSSIVLATNLPPVTFTVSATAGAVTVTQRVPVTSTATTTRTIPWSNEVGSHYHFSKNPMTIWGNLVGYNTDLDTGQRITLYPTATGPQYVSQLYPVPDGWTSTFSMVIGFPGATIAGLPAGTTGTTSFSYSDFVAAGANQITYTLRTALNSTGGTGGTVAFLTASSNVAAGGISTITTGQTFASFTGTSSTAFVSSTGATSNYTTFGYVTRTGLTTNYTTTSKTITDALGTTTSTRLQRVLVVTSSAHTATKSFTCGSTIGSNSSSSPSSASFTTVILGTVNRLFYSTGSSFREQDPLGEVASYSHRQEILFGPWIHSPTATHAYNALGPDGKIMFWLSTYGANDVGLGAHPVGLIPLNDTASHNSSIFTQSFSISSNSTSVYLTYRALTAPLNASSTSSHVKTMSGVFSRLTIHLNSYTQHQYDASTLRSFLSGTGGGYSTGGSEPALLETPSFLATAIHASVGLNGTAGYDLEHDLVYGSGTAASIRNANTSVSTFPVSHSSALPKRILYGYLVSTAGEMNAGIIAVSETTINPLQSFTVS